MSFALTVEEKPSEADREALPDLLEAFNERHWPGHQPWQEVAVFARDAAGAVAGGLYGETYGGWLFIRYLVMPEAAQRAGAAGGGAGRGCGAGARLPFGLGGYLQLPGAGVLPQAGV